AQLARSPARATRGGSIGAASRDVPAPAGGGEPATAARGRVELPAGPRDPPPGAADRPAPARLGAHPREPAPAPARGARSPAHRGTGRPLEDILAERAGRAI